MDDLRSELNDLKQFIVELKADRAATKEKERREAWTKYVAVTIVFFAVVSSIAAQWSGKYSSMTRTQLSKDANDPETAKAQKDFDSKIADYNARKVKIKEDAEKLESRRDMASKIGGKLGLAISCFSVAIATASLCLLTKKKPLWFCSMVFAAAGIAQMIAAKLMKPGP
jgi:uncharacterized membrane protein YoaK (UPF0700 family)